MKKDVALVLSSGGARGMAQIGIIEELERLDFRIKSIAGCSIGALIGALYATNHLQEFKRWIVDLDTLDLFRMADFSFNGNGFIEGKRVFKAMEHFFSDQQIEDLPIPLSIVAADVHTGKEVVFRKGSVIEAIRASISIPAILKPVVVDGMELVDGGVLNPIPIDRVERHENDLLCAVNLNAKNKYTKPKIKSVIQEKNDSIYAKGIKNFRTTFGKYFPAHNDTENTRRYGYMELMLRSFDMVQDQLCEHVIALHQPDILVEVSRTACGVFDFHRADELIEEGKLAFHRAVGWKLMKDQNFQL